MTVLAHPTAARDPAAVADLERRTQRIASIDRASPLLVRMMLPDAYASLSLLRVAEHLLKVATAPGQPGAATLRTAAASLRDGAVRLDEAARRLEGPGDG